MKTVYYGRIFRRGGQVVFFIVQFQVKGGAVDSIKAIETVEFLAQDLFREKAEKESRKGKKRLSGKYAQI